jgi:spore maturation protein CgeB
MILMTDKMTGQESTDNKIKRLEKENLELREATEAAARKEKALIQKLKEYETAFYKELNAQVKLVRQSWTWRIGRLFVDPADWAYNLFRSRKKAGSDKTTQLRNIDRQAQTGQSSNKPKEADFDFFDQVTDPSKKNIAVIFDTFTQSCFSPEFNTICFTPSNWKKVLEALPVDGLIIESAWRGFEDSWKGKIANISGSNQSEVIRLIDWAKQQNIPTIFWNKEDPVHFEQFIGVAKHFDYIFTTDADCIPDYQKHAPKAVVNALPFAAQPKIHNPIAAGPREKPVCFAGTYYDQRYHERKADLDFLLKPSLDRGLEIYDRHYGDTGKAAANLKFPEIYQLAIKGKLDYDDMMKAYKHYMVFLNVNSVKYSPTMFSRRVFELLASGTPVISSYSQGIINILGEDAVFISESEDDTRKHLDYLLGDELNWWKASLNGLRTAMERHTYADRTRFIFETAGLDYDPPEPAKFSVVSRISTMDEIKYLEKLLRQQNFNHFDIILVLSGNEIEVADQKPVINSMFEPLNVILLNENMMNLENEIMAASDTDYIAFFHPDKYYGPNYLRDYSIVMKYASPGIIGKKSFSTLGEGDLLKKSDKGFSFQYVSSIPNATSVHRKTSIDVSRIKYYLLEGSVNQDEPGILSIDPFNFMDSAVPLTDEIFDHPVLDSINL